MGGDKPVPRLLTPLHVTSVTGQLFESYQASRTSAQGSSLSRQGGAQRVTNKDATATPMDCRNSRRVTALKDLLGSGRNQSKR